MKIGKKVQVVKAPRRAIKKFNEKEVPIPVKLPSKEPATAEWKYVGYWGVDIATKSVVTFVATS